MHQETSFSDAALQDFTRLYKTLSKDRRLQQSFVVRSRYPERKAKLRLGGPTKQLQSWLKDTSPVGCTPLA